ncbi:replication protein A 70 kDa DNA-binding subunit B-like [Cannabis sativa]|uniref:replication protein A 70 kDa DNA-binding subunit B-like n=1 Tax=Cannabis sativa TaxID=3483 RepID=UPI0029CAAABA|nr:replication protein A 70 kDa DNA-binding subunit B-like [Cannabis sativa]
METTINNINPTTSNWKAKMIVGYKSLVQTSPYKHKKYLKLTLIDTKGNKVEATIFESDIDTWKDTLNMYQWYYISNARVTKAHDHFKYKDYPYQWIITCTTKIEESTKNEDKNQQPEYKIVNFNDLDPYISSKEDLDILAVAIQVKEPKDVTTTYGIKRIQEIYLIDKSFKPICLTMWGRFVNDEAQKISDMIDEKPIILATNISAKPFKDCKILDTRKSCYYKFITIILLHVMSWM